MADPTPLYKTPDEYVLLAIDRIRGQGARVSDFNIGSAARTVLEGVAGMLSMHSLQLEQLRLNTSLTTAVGNALDILGANYQVARKQAVAATGSVTITRQTTTGAMTVPAGSVRLVTRATPSQQSQTYRTTEDAVFSAGQASRSVPAIAETGGVLGNLATGVVLITLDPINSVDADGGVIVDSPGFTGGTDIETDDAYRARIPLEVQGRVKGTTPAYLAAALRVPGVTSAQVLRAGETGPHGTLAGGAVEVYYQGATALLAQVEAEVALAAEINDNPSTYTATATRLVADLEVFVLPGTDTVAVEASVQAALQAIVAAAGVGNPDYLSTAVQAVHEITSVISVNVPFNDWRKFTDPGGTAADIIIAAGKIGDLALADCTVTVTEL